MRTIKVTGKGTLNLKPDMVRLSITLQGDSEDYTETLHRSSKDTELMKDALERLGFERSALRTSSFNVETKYESYRDQNNDFKQRLVGYMFTHMLKLEFPIDNELLGKTLYTLAHTSLQPELTISYTVSDPEAAKNELLHKAVDDAKEKAAVLAAAAGVTLIQLLSIDYAWAEQSFQTQPVRRTMLAKQQAAGDSYDMNITPEDIHVSDTVTLVWEIE